MLIYFLNKFKMKNWSYFFFFLLIEKKNNKRSMNHISPFRDVFSYVIHSNKRLIKIPIHYSHLLLSRIIHLLLWRRRLQYHTVKNQLFLNITYYKTLMMNTNRHRSVAWNSMIWVIDIYIALSFSSEDIYPNENTISKHTVSYQSKTSLSKTCSWGLKYSPLMATSLSRRKTSFGTFIP